MLKLIELEIQEEPLWLKELRAQCEKKSQNKVAKELGYSTAVINQVLKKKYQGNVKKLSSIVCSLYIGKTVICPVMGEIPSHQCTSYQQETFSATNPLRVKRYQACRSSCNNSKLGE